MAQASILPRPGAFRPATPGMAVGRWWDMNLIRFRGGQLEPIGGNAALSEAVFDSPGRDVLTWHDKSYKRWAAIGTDAKLWAYDFDEKTLYDITPAGIGGLDPPGAYDGYGLGDYGEDAYGTARDSSQIGPADISAVLGDWWSLDKFGEDLMIVPTQDGRLFRWKPATPAVLPVVVPNAPIDNRGVVVTEERHVVLIAAGGNPRLIQWSDQENPEDWTPVVDNLAGDKELASEGRAMRGMRVPGGILILTDNDAHLMRYVGSPNAYGINLVGANCGLMSARSGGSVGGVARWMGMQGFWSYTGTVEPMACDVQDWLFRGINRSQAGKVFAAPHPSYREMWWYWPSEASVECDSYVAVAIGEPNTPWVIGKTTRTASDMSGSMARPILAGADGKLYMHEYGWTNNGASRIGQIYIETADITMESLGGDPERRMEVRQIRHDYAGDPGAMGFRFFVWEEPDGPAFDLGSIPAAVEGGLTDIEFSCRGMRMRLEALTDAPFSLGITRLVYRQGGYR